MSEKFRWETESKHKASRAEFCRFQSKADLFSEQVGETVLI